VDCGSSHWGQDFAYDQYDNLTQTTIPSRPGSTWNPGYNSSNNYVMGATYDASGNMTNDGGLNVYGYDQFDRLAWTAGSGTPTCGTSGKCITYDAFGRMVERSNGGAWSEIWYTQVPGSQITMSGTTASYGYWPSPGRGTFVAAGTNTFLHQDWLGNDRIVSAVSGHTVYGDRAYAPYGEQYNTFGSTNPINGMFAGITGDFDPGVLFDTPNRELAQYQGRWISPDPAGSGWNQYAYVTNPNSQIDPSGLDCLINCDDAGGVGGWGLFFPGAPGFIPSSYAYGPNGYLGVNGGGLNFSFDASGFGGGCGSDFMPCGLPMPTLWQALGLPSLSCPQWMGPQCGGINPAMDAVPANNGTPTNCAPGSPGCSNVPTQRQLEGIKEQQCEQQAQAAFGPFVTQESLTSTLFGGVMGWILGKSIPAIGQGLAVSQVARFDAKALNYNATLQGCRQASGIGGLAQAISFTP
jgi:RHS repeat-associated protein